MPESTKNETALNSQISDAVEQIQKMVSGTSEQFSQAVAQQVTAHTIGLAMQNAVAQQQELYILRNAIVSAAANAIIESNPKEAISLAEKMLSGDDVVATISGLKELLDDAESKVKTNSTKKKTTKDNA